MTPPSVDKLKAFFYWINELHMIYLRRRGHHPPPWTKDPMFQRNKFCNVFRELDRTTVWIRKNWREPFADHKNLAFAMAVARQINRTETLEEIRFPKRWNPERVLKILRERIKSGKNAYTGAYMLTGTLGGDKPSQTVNKILTPLFKNPPVFIPNMTLEAAWGLYRGRPGFGDFLSYEVVSDLRYTRYLMDAPDILTWANPGPGAKRGLHRVWGRPVRHKVDRSYVQVSHAQALDEMRFLLGVSRKFLKDYVPNLELREIEHGLCEWDKYERARLGQGVLARFIPYVPEGGDLFD